MTNNQRNEAIRKIKRSIVAGDAVMDGIYEGLKRDWESVDRVGNGKASEGDLMTIAKMLIVAHWEVTKRRSEQTSWKLEND